MTFPGESSRSPEVPEPVRPRWPSGGLSGSSLWRPGLPQVLGIPESPLWFPGLSQVLGSPEALGLSEASGVSVLPLWLPGLPQVLGQSEALGSPRVREPSW